MAILQAGLTWRPRPPGMASKASEFPSRKARRPTEQVPARSMEWLQVPTFLEIPIVPSLDKKNIRARKQNEKTHH